MKRHSVAFILTLACGVFLAVMAVDGRPSANVPRIGYLSSNVAPTAPILAAFRKGLDELGWIEGQTVVVEWRSAAGQDDLLRGLAAELVQRKVDVIVASGQRAIWAAKQETTTIPIVMVDGGTDPVEAGLVASFARPGGNVTGLATAPPEVFSEKQLELLKEAVPAISRVAVLWEPTTSDPDVVKAMQGTAEALAVQLQLLAVRSSDEFEEVFAAATRGGAEALLIVESALFSLHRERLAALALKHRLPMMALFSAFAEGGGLITYGPSLAGQVQRAAAYVDKILKGAKPSDLPVEQPVWFELVINLKTADALGLTIPPAVLFRADEVIR